MTKQLADAYTDMHDMAHRDALIYGYGFLAVNREGALSHLSPQYVLTLLEKIDQNIEDMELDD